MPGSRSRTRAPPGCLTPSLRGWFRLLRLVDAGHTGMRLRVLHEQVSCRVGMGTLWLIRPAVGTRRAVETKE